MTVIVWDGKTLAADKLAVQGDLKRTVTKIRRLRGHLVGVSGDWDRGQELLHWFVEGADPSKYPEFQKTDNDFVGMMAVRPDGCVIKFERSPYPMEYPEEKWYCIGSGRDFAYGALWMGANAKVAVQVAMSFASSCGMGIDTLTLEASE
jgi:hypothetical protein